MYKANKVGWVSGQAVGIKVSSGGAIWVRAAEWRPAFSNDIRYPIQCLDA